MSPHVQSESAASRLYAKIASSEDSPWVWAELISTVALRGCAFQLNRNAIAVRFNRGREDLGSTGGERRTIRVSGRTPLRTFSAAGHK